MITLIIDKSFFPVVLPQLISALVFTLYFIPHVSLNFYTGLKFKFSELRLVHWATFPVFFGQVTSAYEGIGTVSTIPVSLNL